MDLLFNKNDIKKDQQRQNQAAYERLVQNMKVLFGEDVFSEKYKNHKVSRFINRK